MSVRVITYINTYIQKFVFIFALMYLLASGGFVSESLMLLRQSAFKTTERPCKGNEMTDKIQVKLRGNDSFSPGKTTIIQLSSWNFAFIY